MTLDPLREVADPALRAALARAVQENLGAEIAGCVRIPPGLGPRRFYRLQLGPGGRCESVIARVEGEEDPAARPAGIPPEPPLEPIRALLERHRIPVPRVFASAPDRGFELLEDVGDTSLEAVALRPGQQPARRAHYARALDITAQLQAIAAPARGGGGTPIPAAFERRLDAAHLRYKAAQVVAWLLPWALGRPARAAEVAVVEKAFEAIAREVAAAPARLSHRDYKAANIHVLEPADPERGPLVLIDLQGAFLAPPEYDVVCLLRDPHVPLPEDEVAEQRERIRSRLPDAPAPADFERRFALLTLSRVGKDASRYLYAAERGDRRYLRLLDAATSSLHVAAADAARLHPDFDNLATLLDALPTPALNGARAELRG